MSHVTQAQDQSRMVWSEPERDLPFRGAKAALLIRGRMVVYRRDNDPCIPYPDMLDLPGGGREAQESASECIQREVQEEFGIFVDRGMIVQKRYFAASQPDAPGRFFFVMSIPETLFRSITFGSEGQYWTTMLPEEFIADENAIGSLKFSLMECLTGQL